MKRREFIKVSSLILGAMSVPRHGNAGTPCTTPVLTASGGTTGQSPPCPTPPAQGPDWVDGLQMNTWTSLNTANTAQDVEAADGGQYGNTGPRSVFVAWSGATYIPTLGASGSIIHWGGGHQDYYGNEQYRFDLSNLTWTRETEPNTSVSDWSTTHSNGILPDGTPRVPHTYYYISNDGNRLVVGKRELNNLGGSTVQSISVYNYGTKSWTNHTDDPSIRTRNYDGFVYDSNRGLFWIVAQQPVNLASVDPDVGTWTDYTNPDGNYNNRAGSVYVPSKDCIVSFPDGPVFGLDPGNPTNARVDLTTSGSGPSFRQGDMPHWSTNLEAIVYYPSRSSALHTLTPPAGDWRTGTWVWSQISLGGATGLHDSTTPTFGKFQIVEWDETTVGLLNAKFDGPCYAIRLA